MKKHLLPILFAGLLGTFQSCTKDRETLPAPEIHTVGIWVLNQGTMGNANSSITQYTIDGKQINTVSVGETGNDLARYGNKIYCVISGVQGASKSFIKVFDANTGAEIKTISFNSNTDGFIPRNIAFEKSKAYVSCYDGVLRRIDTAKLEIDGTVKTQATQEGIAISNGKIYVANTSHFMYPQAPLQNTVSVINTNNPFNGSAEGIINIAVANNPQLLAVAPNGNLFVNAWGNYADKPAQVQIINTQTNTAAKASDDFINAYYFGKTLALANTGSAVMTVDPANAALRSTFITDGTTIKLPYGVSINTQNDEVLVTDAISYTSPTGEAVYFDSAGKKNTSFATGPNPFKAVFIYGNKY